MAAVGYAQEATDRPVDELEHLWQRHKETSNRRGEMRQALIQRLRQEIAQSERECEQISQQLNALGMDSVKVPFGY